MIPDRLRKRLERAIDNGKWRYRMLPRWRPEAAPDIPITILVRSWNRPLHLWASLDSLWRESSASCRFILIDNASSDPLTHKVIDAFERRGMFVAVYRMSENQSDNQQVIYDRHRAEFGPYVVLADADVILCPSSGDWVRRMRRIMAARPSLALLGSVVDPVDFVTLEQARALEPDLPEPVLRELIKANSAERRQPRRMLASVINPYPPAGRLLMARTAVLDQTGAIIGARRLCEAIETTGHDVGITPRVVHRHLSLLNLFDYPAYDYDQLYQYLGHAAPDRQAG
ncbi:glycosyltransferase family 2 protein [Novosphingobium sp. TH158]|uniref:glycosyltransferase family 2 protein n=1 Tax=Novosphingobium sp. TH158 TaxID=2067455 RepID=UPI000C7E39AC|nr:glycosyltransferase family A protein [Novosphingobium sp. TH158]PLK26697.1 hypothetical protein C0V78_07210 [Novosphingobium sp. TH158]